MHALLAITLVGFAGWTLATHIAMAAAWSLDALLRTAPVVVALLGLAYLGILRLRPDAPARVAAGPAHATAPDAPDAPDAPAARKLTLPVLALLACTALLYVSWYAFWLAALLSLAYALTAGSSAAGTAVCMDDRRASIGESVIALVMCALGAVLALAMSRPDLDDAFYVAVAAHASANPDAPVLGTDPTHGTAGLPLIFPSYRFASFEVLGAAVGRIAGVTAIEAMHVLMPPFWAAFAVLCTLLLARYLAGARWLWVGAVALALMLVLGECHRGHANFGFARIFQGKAVYVSALVPAIYYLTWRAASRTGTAADAFLLGCAQLVAIGLSNFAVLAAPMAGLSAWLASWVAQGTCRPHLRLVGALAALAVPVPYLAAVAWGASGGGYLHASPVESAASVWASVFGVRQQYLVAFLLLAGPLLASDRAMRARLAVPVLILLGVYLNPWLSELIGKFVTTPPVYWRVVWSIPLLVFGAVGLVVALDRVVSPGRLSAPAAALLATAIACVAAALPAHLLRADNRIEWRFATTKVPDADLAVARRAIALAPPDASVLAPDAISGIISMFERRPPLVSVRGHYLEMLRPALGSPAYEDRRLLYLMTLGGAADPPQIQRALTRQRVGVVVLTVTVDAGAAATALANAGLTRRETLNGYVLWARGPG